MKSLSLTSLSLVYLPMSPASCDSSFIATLASCDMGEVAIRFSSALFTLACAVEEKKRIKLMRSLKTKTKTDIRNAC